MYHVKNESKNKYCEMLGLNSKNAVRNYCQSFANTRDSDKSYRLAKGNYATKNGKLDTRYLGILCKYSIEYPPGYHRVTMPLFVQFFDYYSVILSNACSKSGRAVWHMDGTGSQVNWGVVVGPGDCIQRWDLNMSGTFMFHVGIGQ